MKKIFRVLIFSAVALAITGLWDKGFLIKNDWMIYLKASLLVGAIYYLIVPLSKLILLPLNILTLGLASVIFYCLFFYFLSGYFSLITVTGWTFPGVSLLGIKIGKLAIAQPLNIFISSISVSTVINLLEKLL